MSSLRDFHVFPNSLVMGPGLARVGGSHLVGVNEAMATLVVTVSSVAAQLWTPAEIATALWLDAADSATITLSDSTVSQWADKSGNNRHATQATPSARPALAPSSLGGHNTLTFNGTGSFLTLGTALGRPQSFTVFGVGRFTRALSNHQVLIGASNNLGSTASGWGTIFNLSTNPGRHLWQYGDNSNFRYGFGDGAFTLNEWGIHAVRHQHGVQEEVTYKNGVALTNVGVTGSATQNAGTAYEMAIGRGGAYNGHFFGGGVAEIIILSYAVDAEIREKIEGYLAHKWGLTASLPSGHPYKSAPPTM